MTCSVSKKTVVLFSLWAFISPLIAYCGYNIGLRFRSGETTSLPLNATVWAACATSSSPIITIFTNCLESSLHRDLRGYVELRYVSLRVLVTAYTLSIPVSLWAMSRVARKTEGRSAVAERKRATHEAIRQVLSSPTNQALALFHYGAFRFYAVDRSVSGVLVGLLVELSSCIARLTILKFVYAWRATWIEDVKTIDNMDPRTRVLFLAVTLVGLASQVSLQAQQDAVRSKIIDAESAANLANKDANPADEEAPRSDEKAASGEHTRPNGVTSQD